MDKREKTRENRLRRAANRQGLVLKRSRARDPNALTYGGYQLVDRERNFLVFGQGPTGGYGADLNEVEEFLTEPREKRQRRGGR